MIEQAWLEQLEDEMQHIDDQPHKASVQVTPSAYMNVLCGSLRDGTSGSKTIWYDERTGESAGLVVVKRGRYVHTFDANVVTGLRCGMMAVEMLRRLFPDRFNRKVESKLRVGFVGFGKVGRAVKAAISQFFSIDEVVVTRFTEGEGYRLSKCAVIITATMAQPGDAQIHTVHCPCPVISFDGGLILGPSFRKRDLFADHPAQLDEHWDIEFPGEAREPIRPLEWLRSSINPVIHLYGIGVADLIVARGLLDAGRDKARLPRLQEAHAGAGEGDSYRAI